jgi:ComF family protein
MSLLSDLLWLVYPEICAACGRTLGSGDTCICLWCRTHLPSTEFHTDKENPVAKHFWGKVPIENAAAGYYFSKGEKVQRLIHQLKYKGRRDIGVFLGNLYGATLRQSEKFSTAEIIIPVPLHIRKQRSRGYNQSECIVEGLSQSMKIPFSSKAVKRTMHTTSQTRKKRYERFENVNRVFKVVQRDVVQGKHILLVDDVITTGSTLAACAEVLLEVPGTKVSIATIAYA